MSAIDPKQEENKMASESNISKIVLDDLKEKYKKFELSHNGKPFNKFDVYDILKMTGFKVTDKLKIFVQKNLEFKKKIDFLFILECAGTSKKIEKQQLEDEANEENDFAEYIDAFVSMGGGPGTTGIVKKETIINIIKHEFELTFDMNDFLDEISNSSNDLDFKAFCLLFEGKGEDDNKSVTSRKSILSVFSEKAKKAGSEGRRGSFSVKYKDFLIFCENEKKV